MGLRFKDFPSKLLQGRDNPPMHYTLKMESFSRIAKSSSILKYTSDKFLVEDYTWRLHIYPSGNKINGGEGHISIYLELTDTPPSLPTGWTLTSLVKLFVFDQIRDKYYTVPDDSVVRFSAVKLERGITRFVELEVFNDSSNGYLVGDNCVFGVDIFLIKQPINKAIVLSLLGEGANTCTHIWNIKSFTTLSDDYYDSDKFNNYYESDKFICGDFKWWIMLYPKGNDEGKGNSMSAYLCLDKSRLTLDNKIFVNYTIGVQNVVKSYIIKSPIGENHFNEYSICWGFPKFISLNKFEDLKNEILVNDDCIIQADVTIVGLVTKKSSF